MKKAFIALALCIPLLAWASHKVWASNENILYTDLNGNFTTLYNGAVGLGTALLTNAMVASNAAIAHSKLATPALVPKAWAYVSAVCSAGACTVSDSSQVTGVSFSATGVYNVQLAYTPANANFAAIPTSHTAALYCAVTGQATTNPQFVVRCYDATGAATNAAFSFIVMDT